MRLTENCIQEIKSSANIVEVVADYVPTLKKKGANYVALSPFKAENTPSFYVSPSKQIFKCFSTGKGGDAVTFLMEIDKLTYVEALKYLAKKYNIALQYDKPMDEAEIAVNNTERDALFILLNYAKDYYKNLLHAHDDGKAIGMSYLMERGMNMQTINDFELGYALDAWDAFINDAKKNMYRETLLEKAGLIKSSDSGKKFDFFRNRVIFPIHNASGKVVALAGRIMTGEKNIAKYINSPETELYHKSEILYGLYQARQAIRNADLCYLVEGYMDVLAMYQAGVKNVVASSGTSLTSEQIKILSRYTKNVIILYDGDKAGINAAIRGTDMLLDSGLNIKIVLFPDGHDPDSYIKHEGEETFSNYIKTNAQDFISFKTGILLKNAQNDPIKLSQATHEVVQSIAKIGDLIQRQIYTKLCAALLNIDEKAIAKSVDDERFKNYKNKLSENEKKAFPSHFHSDEASQEALPNFVDNIPKSATYFAEREIVRLLIEYSGEHYDGEIAIYQEIFRHLEHITFENELLYQIVNIFRLQVQSGNIPGIEYFLSYPDKTLEAYLVELLSYRYELSPNWVNRFRIGVPDKDFNKTDLLSQTLARLNFEKVTAQVKEAGTTLKNLPENDTLGIEEALSHLQTLKEYQKQLAALMGLIVSA